MSLSKQTWFFLVWMLLPVWISAQPETQPQVGLRDNTPYVHAFINARIIPRPGEVIEKGTLVVRNGMIQAIGGNVEPPADARVWDMDGMTIYPGLIETYTHAGVKDELNESGEGRYWNAHVRPERTLSDYLDAENSDLDELRKLGFTSAHVVPKKGIFRGQSGLISLADTTLQERLIRDRIAQHIVLQRQGGSEENYPNSLMGVIALVRQVWYDVQWYGRAHERYSQNPMQEKPEVNIALAALQDAFMGKQPVMFWTWNEQGLLRTKAISREFNLDAWYLGSGYEYRAVNDYSDINTPIPIPLNFPKTPDVNTYEETLDINLTALRHWERAPSNPAVLEEENIPITLTTYSLDKTGDFNDKVQQAVKHGLSEDTLLASLTTVPAKMLGVADELGTLEQGKRGHFIITDGKLFDKKTKVMDVWIDGIRYEINKKHEIDPRGKWKLNLPSDVTSASTAELEIKGELPKISGSMILEASTEKTKWIELDHDRLSFTVSSELLSEDGVYQYSGIVNKKLVSGYGTTPQGKSFVWNAEWLDGLENGKKDDDEEQAEAVKYISRMVHPPSAYGREEFPQQQDVVFISNATVWTNGPDGVLENGDVLIVKGIIQNVGVGLEPPDGALIIDGSGKHVTAGLIDCHSHTAIEQGVNETGQAITAEVRIQDVIDNSDINIYRQLAGGLTIAHALHGSANPMGGQSAVIKLKWGKDYKDLLEKRAPGTIKFALGENVKQSNWGDNNRTRYPQTRMGVEQIMQDRFLAAKDYQRDWSEFNVNPHRRGVIPPRKDLELDALVEILNGERIIHCHSYRQDEILTLLRLGERLGFKVGTLQHILEGYKVADEMVKHGAAGSSFSDWWGYKFEVFDAIPFNGALMYEQGVTVSYNSDDDETARRLNTESAKAVKYGGVPEADALKFVTLNPAKQLKIDQYVGSIEAGKDADFAVWSGHPLSTYTRCEQTWIEGVKYFDLAEDEILRAKVMDERASLIQKILDASKEKKNNDKEKDAESEDGWNQKDEAFWFDTIESNMAQQGLCGCGVDHQQEQLSGFQQKLQSLRRNLYEN